MYKKYIVTLTNKDIVEDFLNTIRSNGSTDENNFIPTRAVTVADPIQTSLKSTEFYLTQEEAAALRLHEHVKAVEVPVGVMHDMFANQRDIFWRNGTTVLDGYFTNWGLFSTSRKESMVYQPGADFYDFVKRRFNTGSGVEYGYALDGTGVDIVIQDNGVMSGHPDFNDADGNTRLIEHDWWAEAGVSGQMSPYHYGDVGYHGTHVASTAAGLKHGYAKNARIYSIRFDQPGGIGPSVSFDLIRLWHENKPVDPVTGVKRPTIVNASWGSSWYIPGFVDLLSITDVVFRGNSTGITNINSSNYRSLGFGPYIRHETTTEYINTACQDMIDAGVVFVNAAGNSGYKHDLPGGIDYDNHYTCSGTWGGVIPSGDPIYYNRPGSPWSPEGISVANYQNIPAAFTFDGQSGIVYEVLAKSTARGPGVDVAAPGTKIWAATNNSDMALLDPDRTIRANYFGNAAYNNLCITGTSMAAPQVTGILALYLQLNPTATSAQCKKWLLEFASVNKDGVDTTETDDPLNSGYFDSRTFQGMNRKFVINPFSEKNVTKFNDTKITYDFDFDISSYTVDEIENTSTVITVTSVQDLPEGKRSIGYTILGSGITQDDISVPLEGTMNFELNSENIWESSITISILADELTEGTERLQFRLDNGSIALITITDTSNIAPGIEIQPPVFVPVREDNAIYEGETIVYTVTGNQHIDPSQSYTFYVKLDGNATSFDIYGFDNYADGIPFTVGNGEEINISFTVREDYIDETPETLVVTFEDRTDPNAVEIIWESQYSVQDKPSTNWTFEISPENAYDVGGPGAVYEQTALTIKATPEDLSIAPAGTSVWVVTESKSASVGSDFAYIDEEMQVNTQGFAATTLYIYNDAQTESPEFFDLYLYDKTIFSPSNQKGYLRVKIYDRPPVEYTVNVTGSNPVPESEGYGPNTFYEGSSITVTVTPSYVYNLPNQIFYTTTGNAVLNSDVYGFSYSGSIGKNSSSNTYITGGSIASDGQSEDIETLSISFYKESYLATQIATVAIHMIDNP